jgi:alpha-galactosidase/6-phospho-beta-glucosidase family protein
MHVHHIDGDRTNDNPCNLELLTHKDHNRKHPGKAKGERSIEFKRQCSESMKKRWSEGFYKNKKGRKRSYSNEIVIEILRAITEDKESRVSIARRLKMPRSSVQNIIYGELRNVSNVCI